MTDLTHAELETVIRWDQTPGPVAVYTCDRGLMAKLERRGFKADRECVQDGRVIAKEFNVPKAAVSFRLKSPRTERQRQATMESLKRLKEVQEARRNVGDSDLGEALS